MRLPKMLVLTHGQRHDLSTRRAVAPRRPHQVRPLSGGEPPAADVRVFVAHSGVVGGRAKVPRVRSAAGLRGSFFGAIVRLLSPLAWPTDCS